MRVRVRSENSAWWETHPHDALIASTPCATEPWLVRCCSCFLCCSCADVPKLDPAKAASDKKEAKAKKDEAKQKKKGARGHCSISAPVLAWLDLIMVLCLAQRTTRLPLRRPMRMPLPLPKMTTRLREP